MKKLALVGSLLVSTALSASATTETRVIDGCVTVPIANTDNTAWQQVDPNCNRWLPDSGPRVVIEVPEEEDPVDENPEGEDPKGENPDPKRD